MAGNYSVLNCFTLLAMTYKNKFVLLNVLRGGYLPVVFRIPPLIRGVYYEGDYQ